LAGITSKLSYVQRLGVDAIWLSPFYTSPNKDGGYDVADPRDVDPRFGNLDDAKTMIKVAHSLGLKVVVDIVPNHFSDQHVWFQAALKAGRGSAERSRFHFYDANPDGTPQTIGSHFLVVLHGLRLRMDNFIYIFLTHLNQISIGKIPM
jgi:alpha-glucosidase